MIDKNDVKNTVRRVNNYLADTKPGLFIEYYEDENLVAEIHKDEVIKKMTPESFYMRLRCSGWEYVAEKYK